MATIPDVKVDLPEVLGHLHFDGVLRRGEVLVVQLENPCDARQLEMLHTLFGQACEKFGIGVIILDHTMSVAGKKKS